VSDGRPDLSLRAQSLRPAGAAGRPPDGTLASLSRATGWLNSPPLTPSDLRGRVVLVNFWTYTCINWLRSLPYVRAWAERYTDHGLVVIGIHTPEFDVERDLDNVRQAARDLRVDYPIATDNDYAIWEAFGNHYWPALYVLDAHGEVRHRGLGEGDYDRSERVLRHLLTEAGASGIGRELVSVEGRGVEAPADWDSLRSGETYLGYERMENFVSDTRALDARQVYTLPADLPLNRWALSGDWTVRRQAVVLNRPEGRIAYRFHARDLHLVMAPIVRGESVRIQVRIDGQVPGAAHGIDVDDLGEGTVTEPRLYQLVRQSGRISDRTFQITVRDPGLSAYALTFG
jgi:thiol-disulfide isomerase/thioredoxin